MRGNEDLEFDSMVIGELGGIPPGDEDVSGTNPWRRPIGNITWGLALTAITINNLGLQYILPTIGTLLVYLGFRSLRGENRWFGAAWVISALKLAAHALSLVLETTPLAAWNMPPLGLANTVVHVVMLLLFRQALKLSFEKAGQKRARDPLLYAALWQALVVVIALSPLSESWLAFIPMVVFQILILRSLYRTGLELDGVGYGFSNSPVRISSGTMSGIYLIGCLALVIACCAAANHGRLDASELAPAQDSKLRGELAEMGFPEHILRDMPDEDVALLEDALLVEVFEETLSFSNALAGYDDMEACTVYIEAPENTLYILHRFRWISGDAYWQDGVNIWAANNVSELELINGALLYDKGGTEYSSGFPRLESGFMESESLFFGTSVDYRITGLISYPFGSENQRGYILYKVRLPDGYINGAASMDYVHWPHPFRVPYEDTGLSMGRGRYSMNGTFRQHYTNFTMRYGDAHEPGRDY